MAVCGLCRATRLRASPCSMSGTHAMQSRCMEQGRLSNSGSASLCYWGGPAPPPGRTTSDVSHILLAFGGNAHGSHGRTPLPAPLRVVP